MNRVVLGPRLLVAARATEVISQPLAASTGQAPGALSVPPVALVARSLEDPALLPGTTLVSASVMGINFAPSGDRVIRPLMQGRAPEGALAEEATWRLGWNTGLTARVRAIRVLRATVAPSSIG